MSQKALQKIKELQNLLVSITLLQSEFLKKGLSNGWCDKILESLLKMTNSEFGFICELVYKEDGTPFIKSHGISNIAWNNETQKFYKENKKDGLEFFNFESIWGQVITTGKSYISSNPDTDPHRGGYPKEKGHPHLNSFLALPIKDSKDNVIGIMGIANNPKGYNQELIDFLTPFVSTYGMLIEKDRQDIKEKISKKDLLLNEENGEKYKTITETIPGAVYECDMDWTFLFVSQGFKELTGFPASDIINNNVRSYVSLMYEDDIKRITSLLDKALKRKDHLFFSEYKLKTKSGEILWVRDSVRVLYNMEGKAIAYKGVLIDITEQKKAEELLRNSDKKHSAMIENIGDVIAIVGADGMTKYQSQNVEKWFGWKPEDIMGSNGWDKMHPKDVERIQQEFSKILTKESASIVEYRFKCKDGKYKWIELTAINCINDPAINGVLLNYHDISKRKQSEEQSKALNQQLLANEQQLKAANQHLQANEQQLKANEQQLLASNQQLQANEQQLRAANQQLVASENELRYSKETAELYLNISAEIILSLDSHGNISMLNESGHLLLGYQNQELIGKDWFPTCLPNEDAKKTKEVFKQIMAGDLESVENYESDIITKSGKIHTILWHNNSLKDEKGNITGTLSSGEDITESIKLVEELKQSEEKYRLAMDATTDGLWDWNIQTGKVYFSPSYSKIIGEKDIASKYESWGDRIHPNEKDLVSQSIQDHLKGKTDFWQKEHRLRHKCGEWIWVLGRGNIVERDKNGKAMRMLGTMTDITPRKLAGNELIKAKEKAEESDRLKSAFLANMSHEIRTPMNGILGFTELLKEADLAADEQEKFIRVIEQSGNRLITIINNIINLSRIETEELLINISETDINEQMEFINNFFNPEAEKKGIQLSVRKNLVASEKFVLTDKEKINSVLTNLVKNAIKFSNSGTIELGCERKGFTIEFYVKDTGIGMAKEDNLLVFERFRRLDSSQNHKIEGSGLGLAISKAYVEKLGGEIWVDSELGKGSTFYFTISIDRRADTY